MSETLDYHRLLFHEEQRPPFVWTLLTIIVCVFLFGAAAAILRRVVLVDQPSPLLWAGITGGVSGFMAVLLVSLRLITDLDTTELRLRLWPFPARRIRIEDIESWQVRTYSPILSYGGWGVRWSFTEVQWAFTMRGDQAVQLQLRDGRRLLIGTQRPAELAAALQEAAGLHRTSPRPPADAV